MIFDFSADDALKISAQSAIGGAEILLQEDKPTNATLIFNPNYWFAAISQSDLDSAVQSIIDGVSTIVISDDENADIYDIIVGRLEEGNKAIFD